MANEREIHVHPKNLQEGIAVVVLERPAKRWSLVARRPTRHHPGWEVLSWIGAGLVDGLARTPRAGNTWGRRGDVKDAFG